MNMNSNPNQTAAPTGYGYYQKAGAVGATPNLAAPSSPYKVIDIGTQFCKQYYRMLSVEPEAGYKFYSKMSHLTHGEEGNLEVPTCFGLEEIQQRILAMGFSGCRVFISTIDCQASLQGGVVVVVIGKMQMTGGVLRKFVQSIFLAEQPTGFFVLNDVFRFIEDEEAQSPIQLPHAAPVAPSVAPIASVAPVAVAPIQPIQPVQPPTAVQAPIQPAIQPAIQPVKTAIQPAKTEATWGDSAWNIDAPVPTTIPTATAPTTATTSTTTTSSPAKQQPIKKPDTVKPASQPAPAKEEPKTVESPSSWAAVTVDHLSKWGNGMVSGAKGTSVAAPPKPASTTSATTSDSKAASEPRHFKSRHGQKPAETATAVATESTNSNTSSTSRPRRQFNESYNADASVFVGGVKVRLEGEAIRHAFAAFGAIKNVEMARECFFVEFETADSARKAISLGTVKVNSVDYKVDKRRPPRAVAGNSTTGATGTQSNTTTTPQRPRHNRNPRPRQPQEGAAEEKK